MSGPNVERERLTGGTLRQQFFELKMLLNENSSKQIVRSWGKFQKNRGGRKSNLKHFP
jgi:hypothetical protein